MLDSTWNLENATYTHRVDNSKFECWLAISSQSRPLVASNGGFLISYDPPPLIPFNFPVIIGGEVVFKPKSIDLDLSRSNVIESNKSIEFKRDISISLRILFRQIIESSYNEQKQIVLNYLQYYLSFYDQLQSQISESYSEFYSKPELINLCGELIKFDYSGFNHSLSTILIILNNRAIRTVYYYGQNAYGDLDSVVVEYLRGQGNLVVYYNQITVQFRDGGRIFSSLSAIEAIVRLSRFDFVSVDQVVQHHIPNIVVDANKIPVPVINIVSEIENRSFTRIRIAHLGASYKVLLQFSNISYLNFDHFSFQELMKNFKNMNSDHIEMYLLGLLGTGLSLSPVVISES